MLCLCFPSAKRQTVGQRDRQTDVVNMGQVLGLIFKCGLLIYDIFLLNAKQKLMSLSEPLFL